MDKALLDSIAKMIPEGRLLRLPAEQLANYPAVKSCLITAGGKYKACAFVFQDDAAEVQARLLGGEAINDKKKFQFFETPAHLASRMVEMAGVMSYDEVLEPSAGQGAIAEQIVLHGATPHCIELMPQNCAVLRRKGFDVTEGDFLQSCGDNVYDKIVANPPFAKNQDIDHIRRMYAVLAEGGRMVTLASTSWRRGSQKKQEAFREWLEEVGAEVEDVPAGEFKASGTMVPTVLITIDK